MIVTISEVIAAGIIKTRIQKRCLVRSSRTFVSQFSWTTMFRSVSPCGNSGKSVENPSAWTNSKAVW